MASPSTETVHSSGRPTLGFKKRAIFVINSLAGGGAERVMSTLLASSGRESEEFEIMLVLLDIEDSPYKLPEWIKVLQLDCRSSLVRSVVALAFLFRKLRPDVSLSFLTRANIANVLVSVAYGNACIISERVNKSSQLANNLRGRLAKFLVRLIYPRATRVIAVSQGVAEDLWTSYSVPKKNIVVVTNPIDLTSIQMQSRETDPGELQLREPFVIGMGRLSVNKNFSLLIDAFALSGVRGKLVILGEGPEREVLSRKIANLRLVDRVLMPGFVQNPFAYLRRANIFVLPSNSEGFPNGLVEAMALGIPVVSTNCGSGPSEILARRSRNEVHGLCLAEYGILVPPNSPELMASALRTMEDVDLRRKYGEKAVVRAADFDTESTKDRYWDVVRKVLAGLPDQANPLQS
jgi:glycosyltransferase involved in cell wall biosynthesis